jgi:filamentous hemagglutinin
LGQGARPDPKGSIEGGASLSMTLGNILLIGKAVDGKKDSSESNEAPISTDILTNVKVEDVKTGKIYIGSVDVRATLERIERGESYPHRNDGAEFKNKPNKKTGKIDLPEKPEGYYKEYVVPSEQMDHSGPQRIIIGRDGEAYYTPNHYDSFIKIRSKTE